MWEEQSKWKEENMSISWALCIWRTVHYDCHGDAVMKMTGVELGLEVELEHEGLHKSF